MRRRRQRRNKFYESIYDSENGILLEEFKFYNKTKNIINDDILKSIQNRLKKDESLIYWTNSIFAKNHIGFQFIKKPLENNTFEYYINIIEFSKIDFSVKQFNNTKQIFERQFFLNFYLDYDQKCALNRIDIDSTTFIKTPKKSIKTWDELINIYIKNELMTLYESNYQYFDTFKNDVEIIFNQKFNFYERSSDQVQIGKIYNNERVYEILDVIEKRIDEKNYRIALICRYGRYNPSYCMEVISENNENYIYTDKEKIYFKNHNTRYYLDDNLKEYKNGKIQIYLNLFELMGNNINKILDKNQKVITANIYRFYKERVSKYEDDKINCSDEEYKILKQYEKILEKKNRIKINDVVITNESIEVIGQNFCLKFDESFLNIKEKLIEIKRIINNEDMKFNFNALYENILKISKLKIINIDNTTSQKYKNFKEISFILNDIPISIIKNENRIKINNYFCRINDVHHILNRAICFNSEDDFSKYIKEVSYIGIEWKKMISEGIALQLNNPFHNIFLKTGETSFEKMFLRFSLLWDAEKRNKVYLVLNNIKYPIKYKGKFKQHFNYPQRTITMTQLKKELKECIENLEEDAIIEIVENGIKEAKIIKERGQELVSNTIKEINAIETEIDIPGGKIKGYLFKGTISNNDYFVNKISLDVYKKMNGQWNRRCIVNDANKQRIFEDKLANRLVNVYNEPKRLKNYL